METAAVIFFLIVSPAMAPPIPFSHPAESLAECVKEVAEVLGKVSPALAAQHAVVQAGCVVHPPPPGEEANP